MQLQVRSKRFLAAMLALVLAFTSMNFNVTAYAEGIGEPETEVYETVSEEADDVTSGEGLTGEDVTKIMVEEDTTEAEEVSCEVPADLTQDLYDIDPEIEKCGFYDISGNTIIKKHDGEHTLSFDEAYDNSMEIYAFVPEGYTGEVYVTLSGNTSKIFGEGSTTNAYAEASVYEKELDDYAGKFIEVKFHGDAKLSRWPSLTDLSFEYKVYAHDVSGNTIGEPVATSALSIKPYEISSDETAWTVQLPYAGLTDYYARWDGFIDYLDAHCSDDKKIMIVNGKPIPFSEAYLNEKGISALGSGEVGTYECKLYPDGNFTGEIKIAVEIVPSDIGETDFWALDSNSSSIVWGRDFDKMVVSPDIYFWNKISGYDSNEPGIKVNKDIIYVWNDTTENYEKVNGTGVLTKGYLDEDSSRYSETYYFKVEGDGKHLTGERYIEAYPPNTYIYDRMVVNPVIYVEYNGKPVNNSDYIKPILKCGDYILKEGVDYTIEYAIQDWTSANYEKDPYLVYLSGKGLFGGLLQIEVYVKPADISKKSVYYGSKGKAIPESINFSDISGNEPSDVFKLWEGDEKLKGISADAEGVAVIAGKVVNCPDGYDYVIDFENKAGNTTLTIYGVGNYKGSITKTLKIKADKTLTSKNLKLKEAIKAVTYTGKALTPDFELVYTAGGVTTDISKDDCEVTYSNNVNAGTATVTVTGKPEKGYTGTVKFTFKINRAEISLYEPDAQNFCVEVNNMAEYSPAGAVPILGFYDVSGTDCDVLELVEGKDYTITCTNNKVLSEVGKEASYIIKGIGNFTGEVKGSFWVGQGNIWPICMELPTEYISDSSKPDSYVTLDMKLVDCGKALKEGVDYKWELKNPDSYPEGAVVLDKDSKILGFKGNPEGISYTIMISGIGNYSNSYEYEFTVKDYTLKDITDKSAYSIELDEDEFTFCMDKDAEPEVIVTDVSSGESLVAETDYFVRYNNAHDAGKATAVITGNPQRGYFGSVTLEYKILPLEVESVGIDGSKDVKVWLYDNGNAAEINEKGKLVYTPFDLYFDDNYYLENKKDYTYKYITPKAIHGADVWAEFTFKGNLTGKVKANLGCVMGIRTNSDPSKFEVSGIKDLTYTGKALKQNITVKDTYNKLTFKQGKDLSVRYYSFEDVKYGYFDNPLESINKAGTYVVAYSINSKYAYSFFLDRNIDKFTDDGYLLAYKGNQYVTFEVKPANIAKASVKLSKTKYTYGIDVSGADGYTPTVSITYNKQKLVEGTDFEVNYLNSKKPGTAEAVVTGYGNFRGSTITKTYTIEGKIDINDCTIEYVGEEACYSPAGALPEVVITLNGEILECGKDYTLSATDNKKTYEESGKESTLTIKGKGKYTGTVNKYKFKVISGNLESLWDNGKVTFKGCSQYNGQPYIMTTYTGKEIKASPKIYVDGKELKLNKDYTLSYSLGDSKPETQTVTEAAQYDVRVTGMGKYEGTLKNKFALFVMPADASKMKVKTVNRDYDPNGIYDSVVSVTYGGKTLVEDRDYKVIYDEPRDLVPNNGGYVKWGAHGTELPREIWEYITGKKSYDVRGIENNSYMMKYQRNPRTMNVDAGKTAAYIVGIGNYAGLKEAAYTINGYKLSKANISIETLDMLSVATRGAEPIPEYSATYKIDKNNKLDLVMEEDFYVSEINGVDIELIDNPFEIYVSGTNTLTLVGMGRFTGTVKAKFKVKPIDMNLVCESLELNTPSYKSGLYTSSPYNPNGATVDIINSYMGMIINNGEPMPLYSGANQNMFKMNYSNNKAVASRDDKKAPTLKLTFNGLYSGTITGTFSIDQADVEAFTEVSVPTVKASLDKKGFVKSYKSTPVVKYYDYLNHLSTDTKLKAGRDYTVTYLYNVDTRVFDGKNWVIRENGTEIGSKDKLLPGTSIKVVITGMGNYCGYKEAVYTVTKK